MLLSDLLRPGLIKVHLEAESKREAIGELVDLLVQEHELSLAQREPAIEAVLARESALGTGMNHGIAIPHGASDRVEDVLCALGTAPKGIPFDSRDGKKAELVILLLFPKRSFPGEIRTLEGIQHLLGHPGLKEKLVAARDPQALLAAIQAEETSAA